MNRKLLVFYILPVLLVLFATLITDRSPASGSDKIIIYFFWSEGCPHCKAEKVFLDKIKNKYPGLEIKSLDVRQNSENAMLFSQLSDAYGIKVKGVPTTFIGDSEPVAGFTNEKTSGREIEDRIRFCSEQGCPDPIVRLGSLDGTAPSTHIDITKDLIGGQEGICPEKLECPEDEKGKGTNISPVSKDDMPDSLREQMPAEKEKKNIIQLPFIGEIDTSKTALPYQTVIIGGLDGFNPCAFFVLLTLLGLLIHVRSRKRVLLIGGIFVFFSGFIYFLFMAAWLNIFLLSGQIAAVTVIAGIIALIIALINIKDFFFFKKGVSLSIPEKAKPKLFDRMRKLLKATSFPSIIMGTVVLAVAANTYELFCTAGFPMVYTRILTMHNLSRPEYYLYLILYNIVYVIPLGVIVIFFAFTLGTRKMSEWQGQVLKLVSGMMMLGLGSVLLLRPDLLNNILVTAGMLAAALAVSAVTIYLSKIFRKNTI